MLSTKSLPLGLRLRMRWERFHESRAWQTLLLMAFGVPLLRFGLGLEWNWIFWVFFAGHMVRKLAQDEIVHWVRHWVSPGFNERSVMVPRVWTLKCRWSDAFLAQTECTNSDDYLPSWDHDREPLGEMRLEEYVNRVRIHTWLGPAEGSVSPRPYHWRDDTPSHAPHPGNQTIIWSYSRSPRAAVVLYLTLAGTWNPERKRTILRLTLWRRFVRPGQDDGEETIFSLLLDPAILDDQRGRSVFLRGIERPAMSVAVYPDDEEDWEFTGDGGHWRWDLTMQTFRQW